MKKILLSLIATALTGFAFAQHGAVAPANSTASTHITPPIRCERKELKREHYADGSQKLEMRIHRDKRELHHMRNGMHHEMKRNHHARPVRRGAGGHTRRPMMDHKRK